MGVVVGPSGKFALAGPLKLGIGWTFYQRSKLQCDVYDVNDWQCSSRLYCQDVLHQLFSVACNASFTCQ